MFDYQQLESEKYWLPTKRRDERLQRKLNRQLAFGRFLIVCFFFTGALIGVLYGCGELDHLDIPGTTEQVWNWMGL